MGPEEAFLYAFLIVIVVVSAMAITISIVGITGAGTAFPGNDCVYQCGELPSLDSNLCIQKYGLCTSSRIVKEDYGTFEADDVEVGYYIPCAGLCNGEVAYKNYGYVCSSSDCLDSTGDKLDCDYYKCIDALKPSSGCNSLSNPVGCTNNTVYFPTLYLDMDKVITCPCH